MVLALEVGVVCGGKEENEELDGEGQGVENKIQSIGGVDFAQLKNSTNTT